MLTTFHRKIAMEAALLIGIAKIKYAKRLGVAFRSGAALLTLPYGASALPQLPMDSLQRLCEKVSRTRTTVFRKPRYVLLA